MTKTGRNATWYAASATLAALLAERTATKVASANMSVPRAVANDEIVAQSVVSIIEAGYDGRTLKPDVLADSAA